jgi:hypothetical protein
MADLTHDGGPCALKVGSPAIGVVEECAAIRTSQRRVLRLMREAGLLAPSRPRRILGPRNHDGVITTERPDEMWGTDLTSVMTLDEGQATVFIAVDHCTSESVGIHAAKAANRFEALEPLRQGVRSRFGAYGVGAASGLSIRHDHGSQYVSDAFQDVEPCLCACARRQRLRRTLHPHAEGAAGSAPSRAGWSTRTTTSSRWCSSRGTPAGPRPARARTTTTTRTEAR